MPRPNKPLRIILPIVLFVIGLGVPIAVMVNTTSKKNTPAPAEQAAEAVDRVADQAGEHAGDEPASPVATADPDPVPAPVATETDAAEPGEAADTSADTDADTNADTDADTDTDNATQPAAETEQADTPTQPAVGIAPGTFVVEGFADEPLATDFSPLGGLGFDSPYVMRVEFSHLGAGIKAIRLATEFDSVQTDRAAREGPVDPEKHVAVQKQIANDRFILVPFCALGIEINGTLVPMLIADGDVPAWRQVSADTPGRFEAFLLDSNGQRAFRVEREYTLAPGSHDLVVRQHVENLTGTAFNVRWRQFGTVDLFASSGYGGEHRRFRFGYLYDARSDPSQQFVDATKFLWRRTKLTGDKSDKKFPEGKIWPNTYSQEEDLTLVWSGVTNRYFGAVTHPLIDPDDPQASLAFDTIERIDRVRLEDPDAIVLSYHSPASSLAPGGTIDYSMGLYAGPLNKSVIRNESMLERLGIDKIVVYNFGGMCAFCTFAWLTGPLLGLLRFLHSLTGDWALAIILLVVCVRSVLHPITRWSQVKMLVFGKQMQNIAPKQKILQERYKDDRQRQQQEMAKLWREEGISPAGFLGCLPMLLQSPVWIALYATLFFAAELRHEPAFFGVFQALTNNVWPFLEDLAKPDRAIYFGNKGPTLPLMGQINSINILPLLLGVVFYLQQKYLQPPTSSVMTPEQKSQQKMIKVMMVVMFPLIMYGAPSGLALYFITNSTLGIIESRWIRANATKSGMLEEGNLKKKPKEGGFMARLQKLALEKQQQQEAQRGMSAKRLPKQGKADNTPPRKYKKR
ncbi:MAG: YidC/Oxa1 family insertase periplasmic-domain containing protein [Planctomycetota bacterium]|nr:YidC/Oxa1 family insertase periplasmic-domain containing protein [Planctomycetota bacterium]